MEYKLIYLARRSPDVSIQDWPRTWRSHAVFASQFPVFETKIKSSYYCARITEHDVDGTLADLVSVSHQHDGVAIASSPELESLDGSFLSQDMRSKIDEDELRVFDKLTPAFSFFCREVLAAGSRSGTAAVIRFLSRTDGHGETNEPTIPDGYAELAEHFINDGTLTRHAYNRQFVRRRPVSWSTIFANCGSRRATPPCGRSSITPWRRSIMRWAVSPTSIRASRCSPRFAIAGQDRAFQKASR